MRSEKKPLKLLILSYLGQDQFGQKEQFHIVLNSFPWEKRIRDLFVPDINHKSPPGDNYCVHVQLYRDSKDRYNNGQTKASLSLQYFLAVQSGFTLDKESNTIAILCEDVTVIFAFDTREQLIQWQAKIAINLGEDEQFLVQISSAPPRSKLVPGPARLHVLERRFCLTAGVPPRLLGHWEIAQLRKYGVINGRFCFEGGSQCGRGEGLHVLLTDRGDDVCRAFRSAAQGNTPQARRAYLHVRERSISSSRTEANLCEQLADCRSRSQENLCWSPPGDCSSWEPSGLCHREGTVARPRCRSCHVRLTRSSTVACAPGSGFTWTMESCASGQPLTKSPSCFEQRQTTTLAPVWDPASPGRPPPRPPKTKLPPSEELSGGLKRPRPSPSMPLIGLGRCDCDPTSNSVEEYYDTPRNFKSTILEEPERSEQVGACVDRTVCNCKMNLKTGLSQSFSVNQVLFGLSARDVNNRPFHTERSGNLLVNNGHIYQNEEEPSSLSSDPGWHPEACQIHEAHSNCCCYMNIKANTLCQAKRCVKSVTFSELPKSSLQQERNYENFDFAESLKYYENCKDCYNKLVCEFDNDREFSFSSEQWTSDVFCRNCTLMRQKNLSLFTPATHTGSEDTQGYIKMSALANITDTNDNPVVPNKNKHTSTQSFLRWRSKSSVCLHSVCKHPKDYKIRAISDPEIHLIHPSLRRPRISLSKLIDFIRNLRPVTAQEIQRHARKSNTINVRNRLEESQYHSDDTISSDTMVNTANDMSVKGSLNSLGSENTRYLGGNRLLSASELNLSLSSVPGRLDSKESEIEKYKEHLRNLRLPQLPVDLEYSNHDSTCIPAVRRSCTVNFKPGHNRDSSSSNDSGVSTASLRLRRTDFTEFEMPITTSLSAKLLREYALRQMKKSSSDLSLPRRSKSIDPLGELVFQFQDSSSSAKSTSALLTVVDGREGKVLRFIDAPSTSSGTSDLSDYMDNLSISSYSSNEHPRISRCPATTLKPRSGKEYHKIGHLSLQPTKEDSPTGPEDQSSV